MQDQQPITIDKFNLLLNKDIKTFSANVEVLFELINKQEKTIEEKNAEIKDLKDKLNPPIPPENK